MSYAQALSAHEMGFAYKAITEKMGPSPQLVAFVNYDQALDDNCGLESMNIMDRHQQILTQIDALDPFDLKCDDTSDELEAAEQHRLAASIDELMAGTSTLAIATENQTDAIAMESVLDNIKEKAASWAAKILNVVKRIGEISFKAIGEKIKSTSKGLVDKLSNATYAAGRTIKAHPYKTAMITVGSIVAAAAAITFVGQKLQSSMYDYADEVMDGLTKVFGPNPEAEAGFADAKKAMVEDTLENLGWTVQNTVKFSNAVMHALDQVSQAIHGFVQHAHSFVSGLNNGTTGVATEALHVPGVSKKTSHRAITSLFWMVYRLVKTKIGGGFHHIAALLLRLMGH